MRRVAGLIAWVVLLAGVIVVFTLLGGGELATPAITRPADWPSWAAAGEPLVVVFALLRLLVLAVAWYLVGVLVVGAVLRLLAAGRLVAVVDVVTVPAVRRLLQAALGMGLATAAVVGATGVPRTPATAHAATAPAEGPTMTLRGLEGDERYETMAVLPPGLAPWAQPAPDPPSPAPAPARDWEVRPGEHLWGIAEQVVGEDRSEREIAAYWAALIAANRDRLPDPGNPDLIYPGQVVALPER